MKKILIIAVCCALFYSCKKSDNTPEVPKTVDKNLVIEATCSTPCNVRIDTTSVGAADYKLFEWKDVSGTYKNSYNATGGKSIISFNIYSSGPNPGSSSMKISFKGIVFINETRENSVGWGIGRGVPNF